MTTSSQFHHLWIAYKCN